MPCSRMLNSDSRTRSDVGRTPSSLRRRDGAAAEACRRRSSWRSRAPVFARSFRRTRSASTGASSPSSAAISTPELLGQHAPLNGLDRARLQIEELERPVGDADEAVHLEAEVREDAAHLAVLALAQADVSHALAPCTLSIVASIGPVAHALDLDAVAQSVELGLR